MRNISLLVLVSVLFIGACRTTKNIPQDTSLEQLQGVILSKMPCYASNVDLDIYRVDTDKQVARLSCSYEEHLKMKVFTLDEGEYYIGNVRALYFEGGNSKGAEKRIDKVNADRFSVKAKTINYIGDIQIAFNAQSRGLITKTYMKVGWKFIDNEEKIKTELQSSYPKVASKYPFRKSIASKQ